MKHMPTPELLLSTAKLYRSLSQNNYRITLTDDSVIELRFPAGCYHHLVGLHKFPDIAEVTIDRERGRSAKSIYQDILCGNITEYDLQLSAHYDETVVPDREKDPVRPVFRRQMFRLDRDGSALLLF